MSLLAIHVILSLIGIVSGLIVLGGLLSGQALGGDHSYNTLMADIMRFVTTDVTGGMIKDSGHWVMEEQPQQTTAAIVDFITKT